MRTLFRALSKFRKELKNENWSGRRVLDPDLLHPKHGAGLHVLYAFGVLSIVYTDSGRLLPLTAIGAGIDFIHIFRTVIQPLKTLSAITVTLQGVSA